MRCGPSPGSLRRARLAIRPLLSWGEVNKAQPVDLIFLALERANIGSGGLAKNGHCT